MTRHKAIFTKVLCLIILLTLGKNLKGQESTTYKQIQYARLGVENDLFYQRIGGKTDQDFSAGFYYQLSHPIFNKQLAGKILLGIKNTQIRDFGLTVGHLGFTPQDITRPEIDTLDRPYSGLLFAEYYQVSSDQKKGLKFISKLKLGVIGPATGMESVQKFIHKKTGDELPIGWEYQIGNGLILDYNFKVIKQLSGKNLKLFDMMVEASGEAGTIYNLASAGLLFRFGLMNNFFSNEFGLYNKRNLSFPSEGKKTNNRPFQAYLFFRPVVYYTFYDGTIQGSLINFQKSPYTLPGKDVREFIIVLNYGPIIQYKSFAFRYNIIARSNRFYQEDIFSFGQFDIAWVF